MLRPAPRLVVPRLVVVFIGLYSFAVRSVAPFWELPYLRAHHGAPFLELFAVTTAGWLLVAFLPWLIVAGVFVRYRPRATFTVRDNGFVVPRNPILPGVPVLILLGAAMPVVPVEWSADGSRPVFVNDPVLTSIALVVDTFLLAVGLAVVFWNRPRARLTPTGLAYQGFFARREVAWDEFAPGRPLPVADRSRNLRFFLRRPAASGGMASIVLPGALLHVTPGFLAAAIREYADHPERRAAIGTPEELDRLRRLAGTPLLRTPTAPRIGATLPS